MKRFATLVLISAMTVGVTATAQAEKTAQERVERTVHGSYKTPFMPFSGGCPDSGGCVRISTGARESYFTAKVTDTHGLPVFVQVWAETDGDVMMDELFGTFCGKTTKPIRFRPGIELYFWVGFTFSNSNYESCPGGTIATSGTVSVTLSNRPRGDQR